MSIKIVISDSLGSVIGAAGLPSIGYIEGFASASKYQGAYAAHPTVRLNGRPLQDGDYYFNTTEEFIYYYNLAEGTWASVDTATVLLARDEAVASAAAALASEQATATSETNAATSEANALASQQATATSEANALASQQASATSEANALASEQAAATSEANALASQQAALASEQASATSEANALASQQASATSEANALASEQASATSEANALASEQAAATSEANALASEQASATSESNAELWAVGPLGSGTELPDAANNAYYWSTVAQYNANQTFKSGGYFTPSAGQEYPDITGVSVDTIWLVKFPAAGQSYTFTAGDLVGETVENGYMIVYDTPANTFDFIPTTMTGVSSVNGVIPDATNAVVIFADNLADVYSITQVDAIAAALDARLLLEEAATIDHENRIGTVETQQSTNTTDIGNLQSSKADLAITVTKDSDTGTARLPTGTEAQRTDTTGVTWVLMRGRSDTGEVEAYNPVTNEWGAVGGGGIPLYGQVVADFTGVKKKAFEVNMLDNVNKTVTFDANFVDGDWISLSFMEWGNVAGLYALLDFTDVPMLIRGVEYTTYRVTEPCVLQLQRIAGYWKCVGISNGSGSYYALEQRVDDLESLTSALPVNYSATISLEGFNGANADSAMFITRSGNVVTVDVILGGMAAVSVPDLTLLGNVPLGYRPSGYSEANDVVRGVSTYARTLHFSDGQVQCYGFEGLSNYVRTSAVYITNDPYPTV